MFGSMKFFFTDVTAFLDDLLRRITEPIFCFVKYRKDLAPTFEVVLVHTVF
jgi:hypothetical protein